MKTYYVILSGGRFLRPTLAAVTTPLSPEALGRAYAATGVLVEPA